MGIKQACSCLFAGLFFACVPLGAAPAIQAWMPRAGLYARTTVYYRPLDRERRMPPLPGFVPIGFFVWLAENPGTFSRLWRYPNSLGARSLLVMMRFTIVANLKHVKARIHVPES